MKIDLLIILWLILCVLLKQLFILISIKMYNIFNHINQKAEPKNNFKTDEIDDNEYIKTTDNQNIIFKQYTFPKKKIPSNHILLLDDFIQDSHCIELVEIINQYSNKKENWGNNTNVNCDFLNLEDLNNNELRNKYDKIIFDYISKFISLLYHDYDIICSGDSGYCLRKIYGPTRFHKDGISVNLIDNRYVPKRKIRNMSVIIALNDDYEGGVFHFPNQDFSTKLKKGQLIAFPPYWTHIHGVESPTNNTFRYTINTWLFE